MPSTSLFYICEHYQATERPSWSRLKISSFAYSPTTQVVTTAPRSHSGAWVLCVGASTAMLYKDNAVLSAAQALSATTAPTTAPTTVCAKVWRPLLIRYALYTTTK